MQKCAIVLGGLESGYMRRLALYLQNRLDSHVAVEIMERGAEAGGQTVLTGEETPADRRHTVWVGTANFIRGRPQPEESGWIVLDEEDAEDENHVFRYQSCERLCREIWQRCLRMGWLPGAGVKSRRQRWVAVTADGMPGKLLAFSMTCAQVLGERQRVLYINLSQCSGMEELFQTDQSSDLSDYILQLRRDENILPETAAGRLGQADYLLPPGNPTVLHEIGPEDTERLLNAVGKSGRYDCVVFAVGTAVCGCEQIFSRADNLIHLTEPGVLHACAQREWVRFIRQCTGETGTRVDLVRMPEIPAAECGEYLIDDWLEGPLGVLAEQYLRGGEADDAAVAGSQGPVV